MAHYISDREELCVLDKNRKQKGVLCLSTAINIRGNPKKGTVPVVVKFLARFTADEKYQEIDPEDGEIIWSTYERGFDTRKERDFYVKTFFEKVLSLRERLKCVDF